MAPRRTCLQGEQTLPTGEGTSATNPSAAMTFDPTSREIEDHILGNASFRSRCAASGQGRGRGERHQGEGRKKLEDGSKIPVSSWDCCFLGAKNRINEAKVAQRGDNPVLVMHDGVTKSIFAHFVPREGGGENDSQGFRQFGTPQSRATTTSPPVLHYTMRTSWLRLVMLCKKHPLKVTRNPTVLQKVQ